MNYSISCVMQDSRLQKAAKVLVDYSTRVKKGDRVIISTQIGASPLALAVYQLCLERDAYPVIRCAVPGANYVFFKYAKDHQLERFPRVAMYEMKNTDVVIHLFASFNTRELASIDPKRIAKRAKVMNPITRWRCNKTRWVLFDYPTRAFAQEAGMSIWEYENFVFNAIDHDWKDFSKHLHKLAAMVNKAKHVRIVGEETELEMTIKKGKCVTGDGICNMPGGEIFTAPDKLSVNGRIYFDFPSVRYGTVVRGVRLEFKDGRVVSATADSGQELLQEMIAMDEGSCYAGELGIGCNYKIQQSVNNTLFDEKIGGTIHIALGNAYPECNGKNKSALHWDLIKDLRKKGSAIYLDGKLFQKDGKFIL
ncbi:aminopeptidase [Candidatus Woesearchaeota archaeon]|nr:aminopeptidase [Candidatus Woesearchaeota archaeon]